MNNELKPCPFCGEPAHMDSRMSFWWSVSCDLCHATTNTYDMKEKAIAAWNTRAEKTCHRVPCKNKNGNDSENYYSCSVCGWKSSDWDEYCYHCGAKVVE